MFSLVVLVIIWYALWGKNNPNASRTVNTPKKKTGVGGIIGLVIVLSILGSSSWAIAMMLLMMGLPVMAIAKVISMAKKSEAREQSTEYRNIPENFKLTETVSKRRKYLVKFNKEYELNLTDEQIDRIVDASYFSYNWEREIYDMTKDYNHPTEWYRSDAVWLRAYLKAFPMMNITSDFEMQRRVVEDAFRQIFIELPPGEFMTIDSAIEETNRRFFTLFDETTYMIAFRYMQTRGMKLDFPNALHHTMESEAERLAREYDERTGQKPGSGTDAGGQNSSWSDEEMERLQQAYERMQGFADPNAYGGMYPPNAQNMPNMPNMTGTPGMPNVPYMPGAPGMSNVPYVPGTQDMSNVPYMPGAQDMSYMPGTPDMPGAPDAPNAQNMPYDQDNGMRRDY
ncbi:MAG: hypothetical protein IJM25_12770 [Eubacterium sp.]|nr:hypothetical protein [Eubacterium sp.]